MTLTIKTNNIPRHTISAHELTEKEREEFDYIAWEAIEAGEDIAIFFRYKGNLYDLSQFMLSRNACGFSEWDGYFSNNAWSGILVRYVDNGESVIVATYFS